MTEGLTHAVLIIEDDASLRKALAEHLVHKGYKVDVAENGVKGLAAALSNRPELIILDMRLPGLTGIDILHALRSAQGPQPHVVVLTNDESMVMVGRSLEEGVTDYLVKADVTLERIVALVQANVHPEE